MSLFETFYAGGAYTKNNPGLNDGESMRKANGFLRLANECGVATGKISTVLDVGCGAGGFLGELANSLPQLKLATGIDLNPDAIELANSRLKSLVEYRNCSLDDIKDSYDLITIVHVLEHIPNWELFLNQVKTKSELIYIGVPIEASVWMTIRKRVLLNQYLKYGHIHFFNEELLIRVLKDLGFEILGFGYSDEFLSFNSFSSKIIKIPRIILGLFSKKWACNLLGGYCFQIICKPRS
jgi:SAM-dependent methyltransferase